MNGRTWHDLAHHTQTLLQKLSDYVFKQGPRGPIHIIDSLVMVAKVVRMWKAREREHENILTKMTVKICILPIHGLYEKGS